MTNRRIREKDEEEEPGDEETISEAEKLKVAWDVAALRIVLQIVLFCFNYNVFSIYKGSHESASRPHYQRYLVPGLKMPAHWLDPWRRRWLRLFTFLYILLTAHHAIICMISLLLLNKSSIEVAAYNSAGISYQLQQQALDFVYEHDLMGIFLNILYDHPGLSICCHIAIWVQVSYPIYLAHFVHTKRPYDSPLIRLGIDPCREIRRVNMLVRERMDLLFSGLNYYKQQTQMDDATNHSRTTTTLYFPSIGHWCAIDSILSARRGSRSYLRAGLVKPAPNEPVDPVLRAARYHLEYYARNWHSTWRYVCYVVAVSTITLAYLALFSFYLTIRDIRCLHRGISAELCTFERVFFPTDVLSIAEQTFIWVGLGTFVSIQLINIVNHNLSQLDTISETKYYLRDLLSALRLLNDQKNPRDLTLDEYQLSKAVYLNEALLKTLLKTQLAIEDAIQMNPAMAELVASILGLFSSGLVLLLTVGRLGDYQIDSIRANIIRSFCSIANILVVLCAYTSSKLMLVQPVVWSIVAQLKIIPQRCILRRAELGYLVEAWNEFATHQLGTNDRRNFVCPFGIKLSYKVVISMNFFIISVATFWRGGR